MLHPGQTKRRQGSEVREAPSLYFIVLKVERKRAYHMRGKAGSVALDKIRPAQKSPFSMTLFLFVSCRTNLKFARLWAVCTFQMFASKETCPIEHVYVHMSSDNNLMRDNMHGSFNHFLHKCLTKKSWFIDYWNDDLMERNPTSVFLTALEEITHIVKKCK